MNIKSYAHLLVIPFGLAILLAGCASPSIMDNARNSSEVTAESYSQHRSAKGVVLLEVNWGREWSCGGYQNAELRGFGFDRVPSKAKSNDEAADLMLMAGPNLLQRSEFTSYAVLVEPGEYALAGFVIKVAESISKIDYWAANRSDLMKSGKYQGGQFNVAEGETVYIGGFGLNCSRAPQIWRYQTKEGEDFNSYLAALRKKYPFIDLKQVRVRLFQTSKFAYPSAKQ